MSLVGLHNAVRRACVSMLQPHGPCQALPNAAWQWLPVHRPQLTSLMALMRHTSKSMSGFAADAAAAAGTDAEAPLHPSAALHARRARQKPQNSNRNAFHRAEKKQLQIRVNARTRKKQQAAANLARDAKRHAKWRAGAALWRSTQEESQQDQQQS